MKHLKVLLMTRWHFALRLTKVTHIVETLALQVTYFMLGIMGLNITPALVNYI